jgi:antitoxin YefM
MNLEKQKKLEANGWHIGTVQEFLGLTDEEAAFIERKLALDEFNSWKETLYLLSNPANAEHLRESLAQARMGKAQARELIEP